MSCDQSIASNETVPCNHNMLSTEPPHHHQPSPTVKPRAVPPPPSHRLPANAFLRKYDAQGRPLNRLGRPTKGELRPTAPRLSLPRQNTQTSTLATTSQPLNALVQPDDIVFTFLMLSNQKPRRIALGASSDRIHMTTALVNKIGSLGSALLRTDMSRSELRGCFDRRENAFGISLDVAAGLATDLDNEDLELWIDEWEKLLQEKGGPKPTSRANGIRSKAIKFADNEYVMQHGAGDCRQIGRALQHGALMDAEHGCAGRPYSRLEISQDCVEYGLSI